MSSLKISHAEGESVIANPGCLDVFIDGVKIEHVESFQFWTVAGGFARAMIVFTPDKVEIEAASLITLKVLIDKELEKLEKGK